MCCLWFLLNLNLNPSLSHFHTFACHANIVPLSPPTVGEGAANLGPGTMGLSTRYSPQFTLQHVPDYRQNVYIPGSTATLTSNPQQQQATAQQAAQQALPPPQASAQPEPPKAAQTPASKKKSTKKEKK